MTVRNRAHLVRAAFFPVALALTGPLLPTPLTR